MCIFMCMCLCVYLCLCACVYLCVCEYVCVSAYVQLGRNATSIEDSCIVCVPCKFPLSTLRDLALIFPLYMDVNSPEGTNSAS